MNYNKKIHDLLHSSEAIVTFKTAAAALGICCNEAKTVLQKYVTESGINDIKAVTYILGGVTVTGEHKVVLVSDRKFSKTKEKFKVILIDHIYSIQLVPLNWELHRNSDDFLRSEEDFAPKKIKEELTDVAVNESASTTKPINKHINKKGSISSFFTQNNASMRSSSQVTVKKEASLPLEAKNGKETPSNAIPSHIIKVDKFDSNSDIDDSENFITETKRKRPRVLSDDEEDLLNKCQKIDLLDSENEDSPSDIFGNPEESEEQTTVTEENTPELTEKPGTSSNSERESQKSTVSDNMYEDEDGFIERKPTRTIMKTEKRPESIKEMKRPIIQEQKKEPTKETTAKRKKANTNQQTILNFFNKK